MSPEHGQTGVVGGQTPDVNGPEAGVRGGKPVVRGQRSGFHRITHPTTQPKSASVLPVGQIFAMRICTAGSWHVWFQEVGNGSTDLSWSTDVR